MEKHRAASVFIVRAAAVRGGYDFLFHKFADHRDRRAGCVAVERPFAVFIERRAVGFEKREQNGRPGERSVQYISAVGGGPALRIVISADCLADFDEFFPRPAVFHGVERNAFIRSAVPFESRFDVFHVEVGYDSVRTSRNEILRARIIFLSEFHRAGNKLRRPRCGSVFVRGRVSLVLGFYIRIEIKVEVARDEAERFGFARIENVGNIFRVVSSDNSARIIRTRNTHGVYRDVGEKLFKRRAQRVHEIGFVRIGGYAHGQSSRLIVVVVGHVDVWCVIRGFARAAVTAVVAAVASGLARRFATREAYKRKYARDDKRK